MAKSKAKKAEGLTDKQKRFCDEYLIDLNATQAAIRAGYAEKSARITASQMLGNVRVQDYLQARKIELDKRLENKYLISRERVLNEHARIGFSDIRVYFNTDGSLKNITDLTIDEAAALSSVESDDITIGGKKIGKTQKIKVYDKKGSLDSIAKIMGYNAPEKVDMTNTVDLSAYTDEEKAILLELALKHG